MKQPSIHVRTWSIGQAHDPYGATEIEIVSVDGARGTCYTDGLGQHRVEFYASRKDTKPARKLEWRCADFLWGKVARRSLQLSLKSNLLAKRMLGLRFDEAEREFYEQASANPDPMGSLSRYI